MAEYTCEKCERTFDEKEFKLTNNKLLCILHTEKMEYQKDRYSGVLSRFYEAFSDYVINQLFEHTELLGDKLTKEEIIRYFKDNKFHNKEYNIILKEYIFIPTSIHFPARDGRDNYDYLKILNLFGQIHFNYCEFYLSSLKLNNAECFFQDCKFHDRWTLYNYKVLENQDNVIYQTCEFNKSVSNYHPDDPKELAILDYSQFDYTCRFYKSLEFDRVKFIDTLFNTNQYNYLEENKINKLSFESCTFESKLKLNNYIVLKFICNDSVFKGKFEFKENILESFKIDNSNFESITDLYGCTFKYFHINKSIFEDFAGFENCTFGTDNKIKDEIAIFKHATFKDSLNIRDAKFLSGLDLQNTNLHGDANFLNAEIEITNSNRETFRILKHSFDKIDNIIEANKYYALEMKKYEIDLKWLSNFHDKLVFKFHKISSNHSQDWLLVLFWILNVSFVYSAFSQELCLNKEVLYALGFYCLILPIIFIEFCVFLDLKGITKFLTYGIYIFFSYCIYGLLTCDFALNCVSNDFNPFSIMTGQSLTFVTLMYKVVMAYLIYQLVVSIRQNTRRK